MRAGQLDRRITIEQPTESQGANGEVTKTWATFATVWAQAQADKNAEIATPGTEIGQRVLVFRIRYLSGIHARMRIVYEGAYYDIDPPVEIGRREGLQITGRARV